MGSGDDRSSDRELVQVLTDENRRLAEQVQVLTDRAKHLERSVEHLERALGRVAHRNLADLTTVKMAVLEAMLELPALWSARLRRWRPFNE